MCICLCPTMEVKTEVQYVYNLSLTEIHYVYACCNANLAFMVSQEGPTVPGSAIITPAFTLNINHFLD